MAIELPLSAPPVKRRISTLAILQGAFVSPLQRVQLMSPDDYEVYTLEWIYGHLKTNYNKIRSFAGAGDKGRDVVAYYKDNSVDIYQCKHYTNKIAPTTLYPELGKLCYYTFKKDYPIPNKYVIVAPQGCGPAVADMIENPESINKLLAENWDDYCKSKITSKTNVNLTGPFKSHVENFDFSIVTDVSPLEVIEQHGKTEYYILRFGNGIKKYREVIPKPDTEIQIREQRYTTMLFSVYTEKLQLRIDCIADLESKSEGLLKHFNNQRNAFYSAESLEKFSRENFPESDPLPFDELKEEAESVLTTTLELNEDKSGYERILIASQEIKRQNFASNPLSNEIKATDKDGLCHHLANEDRIKWISHD